MRDQLRLAARAEVARRRATFERELAAEEHTKRTERSPADGYWQERWIAEQRLAVAQRLASALEDN